jgi:hypothetical protein
MNQLKLFADHCVSNFIIQSLREAGYEVLARGNEKGSGSRWRVKPDRSSRPVRFYPKCHYYLVHHYLTLYIVNDKPFH